MTTVPNLSGRRVLVTGSDGFIGSHVVEELVRRGASVRAFVLYNSFNSWGWLDHVAPEIRDAIEIVSGDVRDAGCVRSTLTGCSDVIHLAALIAIPYSYAAPQSYVDTNVHGTLNVVLAARDLGVERVVQVSTSEVYGTARFVPITEAHPLQGQSPYSASKIGADQMALSFHSAFEVPVVVIRPFNTYGPRQSARAVIPTIITQLATGSRVQLGALHPTRDFSFVLDTAAGLIAGLTAPRDKVVGQTINLGSNFEISIGETARLIAEVTGRPIEIEEDSIRLRPQGSEVERLWADNSLARELLGWSPAYGGVEGLRKGLALTAQWFRDPANIARYKADRYNI
jgi:NAD dependent epimerase/dehydratase